MDLLRQLTKQAYHKALNFCQGEKDILTSSIPFTRVLQFSHLFSADAINTNADKNANTRKILCLCMVNWYQSTILYMKYCLQLCKNNVFHCQN